MLRKLAIGLGCLWNSPNTVFGLLLAGLGGFPFLRAEGTALLFLPRGPIGWWFGWFKWIGAMTIGNVIIVRDPYINHEGLMIHEKRHVLQGMILGPFFFPVYLGASLVALLRGLHPYRDNWFEQDAERAARQTA